MIPRSRYGRLMEKVDRYRRVPKAEMKESRDLFRDWKPILFGNPAGTLSSVPSNAFCASGLGLPLVSSYSSSRQILSVNEIRL